jgi:hypothetical protein
MILALLVMITALSISAVAIYYSIAGLVAIFAAAAIPIMIMGGVLEVGKLVTAVWLHRYWSKATWWLKSYLSIAVLVLMFITSMGIFGFLSKAHIEQTSASVENVAQVEQIDKQIAQLNAVISRAEDTINKTETSGTGADQNIQAQIDKEQERIDTAYDRVKPAIDQTNTQLKEDSKLYTDQIAAIDVNLAKLADMSGIDTKDRNAVKLLQQLVGARPDGAYGSGTARAVKAYKEGLESKKQNLFVQIQELKNTAKEEVKRLRARAELEIDDSNKLIERLRKQLGTDTGVDIDAIIDEQNLRIKTANTELDVLTEEKFTIEAEYRKLEAEVGPIKYIAEFVYGEAADKTMLEEAVRWVIIIIIFVFDPLAVLLLIASQYTFGWVRKPEDDDSNDTPPSDPEPEDPEPEDPEPPYTEEEWNEAHRINYEFDRAKVIDANEPPEIQKPTAQQLHTEIQETDNLEKWNDWVEAANKEAEEEAKSSFDPDEVAYELEQGTEEKEEKFKIIPELQEEIENKKTWVQTNNPMFFAGEAEEIKKKVKIDPTEYYDKEGFDQVKKSYTQNEEQTEGTLWSRVKRPTGE